LLIFVNYNSLTMSKYFLVYVLLFLPLTGFTQPETYPYYSAYDTFYQYNILHQGSETNWLYLSGKNKSYLTNENGENKELIAQDFVTCLQSWMCSSVLFSDDNLSCYLNFGRLCLEQSSELTDPSQSNSNLQSSYGIQLRLTSNEKSQSENLLHYEKPVFDISTLHKDEVLQELLKQLRLQEFDFSGVIQEFYRPSTMHGFH